VYLKSAGCCIVLNVVLYMYTDTKLTHLVSISEFSVEHMCVKGSSYRNRAICIKIGSSPL